MNNIAVDCRFATVAPTGVGKFFIDALSAMVKNIPEWNFILISPHPLEITLLSKCLQERNVEYILKSSWRVRSLTLWYNWDFVRIAQKHHAAILWTPAPQIPLYMPSKMKNLIIVHDVVEKEFANTQDFKGKWIGNLFKKTAISHADYIWSNSHYTAEKINQYYPKRRQKNFVIGCSCSDIFQKKFVSEEKCQQIKSDMGIKNRFLLFVGSIEPRKNLQYALRLMKLYYIQHPDVQLLIVGGKGWKNSLIYEMVNAPDFPKDAVVFANYVNIDLLVDLYNIADAFISTSLNEGFGLPQLEAMKCGCPVITACNSAMKEVVEGRGVTIEGWSEEKWLNAIDEILKSGRIEYHPDLSEYGWKSIVRKVKDYIEG